MAVPTDSKIFLAGSRRGPDPSETPPRPRAPRPETDADASEALARDLIALVGTGLVELRSDGDDELRVALANDGHEA